MLTFAFLYFPFRSAPAWSSFPPSCGLLLAAHDGPALVPRWRRGRQRRRVRAPAALAALPARRPAPAPVVAAAESVQGAAATAGDADASRPGGAPRVHHGRGQEEGLPGAPARQPVPPDRGALRRRDHVQAAQTPAASASLSAPGRDRPPLALHGELSLLRPLLVLRLPQPELGLAQVEQRQRQRLLRQLGRRQPSGEHDRRRRLRPLARAPTDAPPTAGQQGHLRGLPGPGRPVLQPQPVLPLHARLSQKSGSGGSEGLFG